MTTDDEIIKEIMQSPNEFIFNSPLDLEEDIIKLLKEAIQKSRENCIKEILEKLNFDNLRRMGFSNDAVNQLVDEDDNSLIILEVTEEIKQQFEGLKHGNFNN